MDDRHREAASFYRRCSRHSTHLQFDRVVRRVNQILLGPEVPLGSSAPMNGRAAFGSAPVPRQPHGITSPPLRKQQALVKAKAVLRTDERLLHGY